MILEKKIAQEDVQQLHILDRNLVTIEFKQNKKSTLHYRKDSQTSKNILDTIKNHMSKKTLDDSLYAKLKEDIYVKVKSVFGTKNDYSTLADIVTWEAMLKRPVNFIDAELGFENVESVISYAQSKINKVDEYALFRLKKLSKYRKNKG